MSGQQMKISIIAATDTQGGIGKDGRLPWNCLHDLELFKSRTMGHFVIVGRTTWETMKSDLPGRRVIVLSKNPEYSSAKPFYGTAGCLEDAIKLAKNEGESEVFVIGGQSVYTEAIQMANVLYISRISGVYSCDTFFPTIAMDEWALESVESPYPKDCSFYVCIYRRKC
ncbi:dihydrofolate reductase [candidate division WWE3 bacterium]|uniref:Dihydrofolate reductase n=1 Tax=candidate division WWE3 bacterium TaxID=2053526 RepID=A0A7X9HGL9_UNCKA|nr:dihydrofolate reductase [candidate division WWE3 bacterium]